MEANAVVEELTPREERDRLRSDWINQPGFYNQWVHLGITSICGGGLVIGGIAFLDFKTLGWTDALFFVGLLLVSNAFEWRLHRDFLHKRVKPVAFLFDQHTPRHHRVFNTDDMSVRSTREYRLVLMPAYAIIGAFFGLTPVMALLWFGGHHNLAALFAIETMGYIVSYEWLHLSYHLPPESFVGRLRLVRWLKQHHAIHHDPRLMQKWNFNVTIPLWDLVRRTYVHDREQALPLRKTTPQEMRISMRHVLALTLLLAPSWAMAESLDALLVKGPVVVVERDGKDRFKSCTGVIAVDVPIDRVWNTIIDFQRYTEFVPKVVKSDTEDLGPNERRVSWEIEVPGPNTKYKVAYHLDPANHAIKAEQVGGDLKGSFWSWYLESTGPSRTLIHYTSHAQHFSSILESVEDDQQTITIGVNVGGTLAILNALKTRLMKG